MTSLPAIAWVLLAAAAVVAALQVLILRRLRGHRVAEQALRESEARFRSVLETAPDPIVISDGEGTITMVNQQAEAVFGWTRAEMIGRPVEMLVPESRRGTHGGHRGNYVKHATVRPMAGGRALEVQRRDGTRLPVEISLAPVRTERGLLVTSIVRDLTTRRRAEQRLRLLEVALEAAANAVVITDREGRIQWVNPAFTRLTGYAAEEAVGQSTRLLRSGAHEPGLYAELWQTVLRGEVWQGELVNRRKDDTLYTEEQTIAPVTGADGAITHFVAIKQDVSERKQVEQLRESLTRTMVHDLRNPLTVVSGALSLLDGGGSATHEEALVLARRNTQRLLDLVTAILELQGLRSGQLPLQEAPVDLHALALETVQLQSPLAAGRRQSLESQVPPGLPAVRGDRALLSRVLQNLVGNALKFTPEDGRVVLAGRHDAEGRLVEISVTDDGPGIEPALLPRLFQEFVTGGHEKSGNGIGLAFCRLAAEAHGGRVAAESAPGGGATFRLTLPSG